MQSMWIADSRNSQRPDLVTTEAHITHATRKLNNALKTKAEVEKSQESLQLRVDNLEKELISVKKAADAAQGSLPQMFYFIVY